MIQRYTRPEMGRLWTAEHKYETWLRVELLALEAWADLGVVPREAVEEIRAKAVVDPRRIAEIEAQVHHDVIAFTTAVAERVGPAARWFHYGLTSTDVVDTAQSVILVEAADLLIAGAEELAQVLKEQALRHRHTVIMGRTHGVHAEPTSFGLKFALWYCEMQRNLERLRRARETVRVGKISGAVGNYAHVDPEVERRVCAGLGLEPAPVSTQVLQRDRHAEFMTTLAVVGGTLEKIAVEIRHLQRTEVREVEEPFRTGQKGSSAMPHKRNPEKCERISGLARVLRANALAALENQALWHERDISHSSVERVILPDSTIVLDYMLHLLTTVIRDLHVYPGAMAANLNRTGGLIYSQRLLLELVASGMTREGAYAVVQELAMAAWQGGATFQERVLSDPRITGRIARPVLESLFDPGYYLRRVDEIYRRLGWEQG